MKSRIWLCGWLAVLASDASLPAEESVRLLAIQTAQKDAIMLRAELSDATKAAKPGAIEGRKGVTVLADFKESKPWRLDPIDMGKVTGELKMGGETVKKLGVFAGLEGGKFGNVTADALRAEIAPRAGGNSYWSYAIAGSSMVAKSGRWEERACWGDEKETYMLWQYAEVDPPADPNKAPANGAWDCVKVDMLWFQASEADMAKLALAKPENRDKAIEWLRGKAKLWKECGVLARAGERVLWNSVKSEVESENGNIREKETGLYLDGGYSGRAKELKMEWTVLVHKDGNEENAQTLASPMTPGVWVFLPVKDIDSANLVACRLSPDE